MLGEYPGLCRDTFDSSRDTFILYLILPQKEHLSQPFKEENHANKSLNVDSLYCYVRDRTSSTSVSYCTIGLVALQWVIAR